MKKDQYLIIFKFRFHQNFILLNLIIQCIGKVKFEEGNWSSVKITSKISDILIENESVLCFKKVTLKHKNQAQEYLAIGTSIISMEGAEDTMYEARIIILELEPNSDKLKIAAISMQKRCVPVIDSSQGALVVFAEDPDAVRNSHGFKVHLYNLEKET